MTDIKKFGGGAPAMEQRAIQEVRQPLSEKQYSIPPRLNKQFGSLSYSLVRGKEDRAE